MELIPAIDIIDGQCVRLTKGDYEQKTVYSQDPVEVARRFSRLGLKRLHVVDLDGAKASHVVNIGVLRRIVEDTGMTVDFGGGIKSQADLDLVFQAGAAMATIGSLAVKQPQLLFEWVEHYGADRIVLGADVRNGKVSINGWKEDSAVDLMDLLNRYVARGIQQVLCTDISRDGMLTGPSIELYTQVMAAHPDLHLIASGGVSSMADIRRLNQAGIPAVVVGKAIYEGRISLEELSETVNNR